MKQEKELYFSICDLHRAVITFHHRFSNRVREKKVTKRFINYHIDKIKVIMGWIEEDKKIYFNQAQAERVVDAGPNTDPEESG